MGSVKTNIVDLEVVYNKLNTSIDKNITLLKEGATAVEAYNKKISVIPSQFQKSLTDIKTKTDAVTQSTKNLNETEKQVLLTAKQREQQSIKESNARNSLLKQKEREIAKNKQLNSAYLQLSKAEAEAARRLQDLIAQGKRADQTQRQYNATLKAAQSDFDKLRARVIMADTATKRFNRNVGNYPQMFKGMAGGLRQLMSAFGLFGGIYLFANAIRGAFKTVKEFDKANADLAATMGKTRSEITALTNDQKRLGATTKFTATEVAGLQKEFAKLGFSQKEILNATEATLALAAAVDTDLANAAMVSGATLRGFGMDASEMARVTDVMASSFTKSALDIENFRESMKYVAPIAGQTGVSIEFATAMLGKLADAGVKGSQAGTSLRRILTEMAKTGLPAAQAFDKVAKSGISVTDAMDEVGRTAQTALLVLSKSKAGVNELAKALENAGGSAQKMADEQLNSLQGQITLLSSAWDGFILSLNKGDGVIANTFKLLIKYITGAVNGLNRLMASSAENFKSDALSAYNVQFKADVEEYGRISSEFQKKLQAKRSSEKAEENIKIIKAEIDALAERNRYLLEQSKIVKNAMGRAKINSEIRENTERLEENGLTIKAWQARYDAAQTVLNPTKKGIEEVTDVTNKNTEATKENTKAKQDARFALVGSVEWFEKLKRALQEEQNQLSTNSEKWQEYQVKIDQVEKSIKQITDATKELEGISIDINDDSYVTDKEGDKIIQEAEEARQRLKELLREFKQGFVDEFASNSGFSGFLGILQGDLEKFEGDAVATALAVSEAFQEAFNTIAQASQANFEAEYARLSTQRDFAIEMAGSSATAKEEIDRQYDERKKAIQRREAEAQKRLAIFNVVTNTAQAILATYAKVGFPAGIPLAVAMGAIGAFQVGMIASQEIPQFWKGTENAPEGLAWTQEKGAEVITDKSGNVKTLGSDKGAQLTYLNKGDKVYKSHEDYINKVLSKNGISDLGSYINIPQQKEVNNSFDMSEMKNQFSKLASVIKNKEGVNISIDEKGFRKKQGNVEFLNNRLNLKSRQV